MKSRKSTKRALVVAVLAAIGAASIGMNTASANVIADGAYNLVINPTPTYATPSSNIGYAFGNQTKGWNSSFTFGGAVPAAGSNPLTDNGVTVATNAGPAGSGIAGDGWSGILGINVTGTSFTINGVGSMSGTIDQTTGAMTLDPTGRLGAVADYPSLYNEAWNISNGGTTYQTITTGTANNGVNSITGTPFTAISGTSNYQGTLVSGTSVGTAWGPFTGDPYFEVWNVKLLATTAAGEHSGFNVDVIKGTAGGNFAEYVTPLVAPVPIPAAAWLFGSGLIGLVGIARRKKSS